MKLLLTFSLLLLASSLQLSAHEDLISLNEEVLYYPDGKSIHIKKQYYVNFSESFSEKILHGSYETYYHVGNMNTEEVYFHGNLIEKKHWSIKGNLIYHRVLRKERTVVSTQFTYYENSDQMKTSTIMTYLYIEGLDAKPSGIIKTMEATGGYHKMLLFDRMGKLTETIDSSDYRHTPRIPKRILDRLNSRKEEVQSEKD